MVHRCGHQQDGSCTRKPRTMTKQHHTSFTKNIFGSAQRLFRSNKTHGLLAPSTIDSHTARDIGINLVGLH
jgi:hypothetical protein